jgi:hypothetical protein
MPREAPSRPPPQTQKRQPTSFQLFPNARELVLRASDRVYNTRRLPLSDDARSVRLSLDVRGVFRLPGTPAEAEAARAALAGVTRLEVSGGVLGPGQLAAALPHLPGLRAVALTCDDDVMEREPGEQGCLEDAESDLVAALAGCPRLESLEWDLVECFPGAPGHAAQG